MEVGPLIKGASFVVGLFFVQIKVSKCFIEEV